MSATVTHEPNQKTLFVLGTCPSAIVWRETGSGSLPARESALLDLEQSQRLVLLGEALAQPGRELEKLQLALHRRDTIRRARRLRLLLDAPVHAAPIGTLQLRPQPAG
eukprot:scaffold38724_cov66-Phaeocystis_antarctica.AAC.3